VQPLLEGEASGIGTRRRGRRPGRRAGVAVTSILYEMREKKRMWADWAISLCGPEIRWAAQKINKNVLNSPCIFWNSNKKDFANFSKQEFEYFPKAEFLEFETKYF
jgi:hypothetical protein